LERYDTPLSVSPVRDAILDIFIGRIVELERGVVISAGIWEKSVEVEAVLTL